jgi:SET domain-containing protein
MLRFLVKNKKSKIDGMGAFASEHIPARRKIGNLGGEIISVREARRRAALLKRVAMVEFGDGRALDASVMSNELRYINHSCSPNTFMRVCYGMVEFYSLRSIMKGEELTCHYGTTHHDGKRQCTCGAKDCIGYI